MTFAHGGTDLCEELLAEMLPLQLAELDAQEEALKARRLQFPSVPAVQMYFGKKYEQYKQRLALKLQMPTDASADAACCLPVACCGLFSDLPVAAPRPEAHEMRESVNGKLEKRQRLQSSKEERRYPDEERLEPYSNEIGIGKRLGNPRMAKQIANPEIRLNQPEISPQSALISAPPPQHTG